MVTRAMACLGDPVQGHSAYHSSEGRGARTFAAAASRRPSVKCHSPRPRSREIMRGAISSRRVRSAASRREAGRSAALRSSSWPVPRVGGNELDERARFETAFGPIWPGASPSRECPATAAGP